MVRQGLKKILDPIATTVDEVNSGSDAMAYLSGDVPDVILLDISLPDRGGLEVLQDILAFNDSARVIILTMHPERQYAVRAIKLGAKGYLHKSAASEELIKAVQKVANGQKYITEAVANGLADMLQDNAARPHEALSNREMEVLKHFATGKMPKEIADALSLSPKTISTLRERILQKLGLTSNAEMIRYAIKEGLVD